MNEERETEISDVLDSDDPELDEADTSEDGRAEPDCGDETAAAEDETAAGKSIPARIGVCALVVLLSLVIVGYAAMFVALRGPSDSHRENAVIWLGGNSMGRFLLSTVMSESEIAECERAKAEREEAEAAASEALRVEINADYPTLGEIDRTDNTPGGDSEGGAAVEDDDGIEVIRIETEYYKGTLMIVDDPKRIFVGTPAKYGTTAYGLKLRDMIRNHDAVGGINAGGFIVYGDVQTGGYPMGFVIKDSKIIWEESKGASDNICGFDADGKLIVGTMTPQQAINAGVVNAVSFGPALIIEGKPVNTGHWLGVERNARTAIGQRADGAILLLVIEGRHIASFGAYFTDVIEVMLEHGAVNATNLDGGYSTFMVYDEGGVDMRSYAYGERYLPTSILIGKKQ